MNRLDRHVANVQNKLALDRFIAGLACHGKYCDDLSLYCVQVTNISTLIMSAPCHASADAPIGNS